MDRCQSDTPKLMIPKLIPKGNPFGQTQGNLERCRKEGVKMSWRMVDQADPIFVSRPLSFEGNGLPTQLFSWACWVHLIEGGNLCGELIYTGNCFKQLCKQRVNVWDSWIKVQESVRPNAKAGWTEINRSIPCVLLHLITALEGFRDNMKGSARFLDCFALVCAMAEDATPVSKSAASIEEAQGVTQWNLVSTDDSLYV